MKKSLLVVALVGSASTAFANPEVVDHRSTPSQPSSNDGVGINREHRYRRRPGPKFMMPLKIDIGAAGVGTDRGMAQGIGAAVGIHWASLSPTPTQTDVGIGVFGALMGAPDDPDKMNDKNGIAYGGAYLEVGHTLSHGNFWRTWATGRGEYLGSSSFGEDHTGFGAAGRLSAELYVSGVGIAPRGVFLGTYAIGVYVEAGVRDLGADVGKFQMSGGLTFRTPLVFAP